MQDYFKYDKIQGGSSLFMKSDSDGEKDKDRRSLPLGIKTNAQGIKSFTNWSEISNSIDRNGKLSLDDHQATSLKWTNYDNTSFYDDWEASDISIVDDLAFVAYEKYTDVNKEEVVLSPVFYQSFRESVSHVEITTYDVMDIIHDITRIGFGGFYFNVPEDQLNRYYDNYGFLQKSTLTSSDLSNCIIKVEYKGKIIYCKYGGDDYIDQTPLVCSKTYSDGSEADITNYISVPVGAPVLGSTRDYRDIGKYDGLFYLVDTGDAFNSVGRKVHLIAFNFGDTVLDSLTNITADYCQLYRESLENSVYFNRYTSAHIKVAIVDEPSITIIKTTPIRRCGKVDVYTRKRGIVSSIINNAITSPLHNLNTNDIIKIESALFDGNQTGPLDIHPLNGEKFIKKIDNDTFEIYDDQFFEKPSSTQNLKSTNDIIWSCVGNSVGGIGSGWDYYKTMFSPTGRNGYIGDYNNFARPEGVGGSRTDSIFVSDANLFLTNKRIKSVNLKNYQTNTIESPASASIDIDLNRSGDIYWYRYILEEIPTSTLGETSFSHITSAVEDFYPYSQTDANNRYIGNMFGSAIDCKFSHNSGSSKVYILAVGEKGSDVSIDFPGITEGIEYSGQNRTSERGRRFPEMLPYGKIHLFHVTVDMYGRISDISHKNTLCGSGRSLIFHSGNTAIEMHPWDSFWLYTSNNSALPSTSTLSNTEQINILKSDTSHYWHRASIPNWFGVEIPDYHGEILRELDDTLLDRGYILTDGASFGDDKSRFGTIGTNDENFKFRRINRVHPYTCPWFDSFGKSLTLGKTIIDDVETIVLFGGSSVVAKVESALLPYAGSDDNTTLWPKTINSSYQLSEDETKQQIGQITGFTLDNNCVNTSFFEITSGGSTRTKLSNSYILADSDNAGSGHKHVARSCKLSAKKLIFRDDFLMWANQRVTDRLSTIHILKHVNGVFTPHLSTSRHFLNYNTVDSTTGVIENLDYVGDGFGWDMKWNGYMLVTNSINNVSDLGDTTFPVDVMLIYKFVGKNNIEFVQQISPTLNILNEKYTKGIVYKYINYLIPSSNITYDNNTIGSYTWNIRLIGKYDIIGKDRIILKDPIEYSLFGRDYSVGVSKSFNETTASSTTVSPYFYYNEYFKDDKVYYDYGAKSVFTVEDTTLWSKDAGQLTNYRNIVKTPVFFLDIPQDSSSFNGDLTVSIRLDSIGKRLANIKDIDTLGNSLNEYIANDDGYLIPKLVLYSKDPRSTIIPNGFSYYPYLPDYYDPWRTISVNGYISQITNPNLLCKLLKEHVIIDNENISKVKDPGLQPPLFRCGAHDMYQYAAKLGSSASELLKRSGLFYGGEINAGELYDISYGKNLSDYYALADQNSNNVGLYTDRGLISWCARDNGTITGHDDIFPYAKLLSGYSIIGDTVVYTIPHETWSRYLVYGNLLKSSINNRPMFQDFTNLKHGVASSVVNDNRGAIINGSWGYNYNDTSYETYTPKLDFDGNEILPKSTLAIGFVLTSMSNVDLFNVNDVSDNIFGSDAMANWRYVEAARNLTAMQKWHHANWSKYSYTPLISDFVTNDISGYSGDKIRSNVISTECYTKINRTEFYIETKQIPKRKFTNIFHKIAVFDYDQSEMYDVKSYSHGFSRYSFVPSTATNGYFLYNASIDKPEIESIIKASNSIGGKINIISSDGIMGNRYDNTGNASISSIYVKNDAIYGTSTESLSGLLGDAYFRPVSLLGAFDVDDTQYLSLTVFSNEMSDNFIDIAMNGSIANTGNIDLSINGVAHQERNMTLWAGQKLRNTGLPLNVSGPDKNAYFTLQIKETAPSGNIPLNISGPDYANNLTLAFPQLPSGSVPLYVMGPLQVINSGTLNIHGRSNLAKSDTLFVSGVGKSNYNHTMYIGGLGVEAANVPLFMNIPRSGSMSLWTGAPITASGNITLNIDSFGLAATGINMHIGTTYDIGTNITSLYTQSERLANDYATLNIDGKDPLQANSLKNNIDAPTTLERNNKALDISSDAESATSLIFNSVESTSNSIIRKNLWFDEYQQNYTTNNGYGDESVSLWHYYNVLSYIHFAGLPSARTKNIASYANKKYGFINNIGAIRKPLVASNSHKLVIATGKNTSGPSIQIYNSENGQFNFVNEISGTLINTQNIVSTTNINNWKLNGNSQFRLGDSFSFIANMLYSLNPVGRCLNYEILDISLSNLNKCAISAKILKYDTSTFLPLTLGTQANYYHLLIILDLNNIQTNGEIQYLNQEDITVKITSEGQHAASDDFVISYGDCVDFIGEDLYISARSSAKEGIILLPKSTNYSQSSSSLQNESYIFDFDLTDDASGYLNNISVLDGKITGFGRKFKSFVDNNGDRMLFISAPLYDPYTKNTITEFHETKPIGAIYIYKRVSGSLNWNYIGAVYGGGNTSENIISNLSDYTPSTVNYEYRYFGFDFDYQDETLLVSQPGGNLNEYDVGTLYTFKINDSITLQNTYSGNDISDMTLDKDDIFGESVVLFNRDTPITISRSSNGCGLIHNMKTNTTLDNSYIYSNLTNIENEWSKYETPLINSYPLNTYYINGKSLDFTSDLIKTNSELLINRIFEADVNRLIDNVLFTKHYLPKIQSVNILAENGGFPLSISGPSVMSGAISLMSATKDSVSTYSTLYVGGNTTHTAVATLSIESPIIAQAPLFVAAGKEEQITLYINTVPPSTYNSSMPVTIVVSPYEEKNQELSIALNGGINPNATNTATLFIGKDINANTNIDMSTSGFYVSEGSTFKSNQTAFTIAGMSSSYADNNSTLFIEVPSSASLYSTAPLFTKTDIPSTGIGGGYIHSGNINISLTGNNDANIFTDADKTTTLSIVASVYNSGSMPLYIEKATGNIIPLIIKNQNPSGIMPIFVSGAYMDNASISLTISPPTANTLNISTRGFLE